MPSMTLEDLITLSVLRESEAAGNTLAIEQINAETLLLNYKNSSGNTVFNPASDGDCLVMISLRFSMRLSQGFVICNRKSIDAHRLLIVNRVFQNKVAEIETDYEKAIVANKGPNGLNLPEVEFDRLRNSALCAANDHCAHMASPGVVMGESELLAVACIHEAIVEVHVISCGRSFVITFVLIKCIDISTGEFYYLH